MADRSKMLALIGIAFGLLLIAGGAIVTDLGNTTCPGTGCPDDLQTGYNNMRLVYGPMVTHAGMFFFVGGLFVGAFFWESADPFVRLFMLILGFVALLLVLASTSTIF